MVVIERAANTEKAGTQVVSHSCHFPHTINSNLLGIVVRRWDQHFNSNICSKRRANAAENQGTVQSNIGREAAFCVVYPIVPVKNDGQSQLVSHRSSSFEHRFWGHGKQNK